MGASENAPGVRLDAELTDRVRLATVTAGPVAVASADEPLIHETNVTIALLAERHAGRAPAEIEELQAARALYRSFGIDPTKTRPSSEALLRRVLRDKPWPRVSNAVDLCNLLSVRWLLPLGLYDADRIEGDVELRRGKPGESYPGIRKDDVHVEGRPVLTDDRGPFGNPTSDSLRTCVGPGTVRLMLVIFFPRGGARKELESHVLEATEAMERHLGTSAARPHATGTIVD